MEEDGYDFTEALKALQAQVQIVQDTLEDPTEGVIHSLEY